MHKNSSASWIPVGCMLALLLATSCMTSRLSRGETAFVYVAANGVITFSGQPVALDELPRKLKMAGATRATPIKIVPQGEVSARLLRSIAGNIGRKGLPHVVIMEPRKAVTIVGGRIMDEVLPDESQNRPTTPRP
jgi:biopolymer transport protein ExbD